MDRTSAEIALRENDPASIDFNCEHPTRCDIHVAFSLTDQGKAIVGDAFRNVEAERIEVGTLRVVRSDGFEREEILWLTPTDPPKLEAQFHFAAQPQGSVDLIVRKTNGHLPELIMSMATQWTPTDPSIVTDESWARLESWLTDESPTTTLAFECEWFEGCDLELGVSTRWLIDDQPDGDRVIVELTEPGGFTSRRTVSEYMGSESPSDRHRNLLPGSYSVRVTKAQSVGVGIDPNEGGSNFGVFINARWTRVVPPAPDQP